VGTALCGGVPAFTGLLVELSASLGAVEFGDAQLGAGALPQYSRIGRWRR